MALHDYYILVPEAIAALEERETLLHTLHQQQDDLTIKQQTLSSGSHLKVWTSGIITTQVLGPLVFGERMGRGKWYC